MGSRYSSSSAHTVSKPKSCSRCGGKQFRPVKTFWRCTDCGFEPKTKDRPRSASAFAP